jgi:hypothetical protein
MPERPLLIFPAPEPADRGRPGGGGADSFTRPDHSRQGSRVTAKLDRLQQSLEGRTAEVRATSSGIDPSQVIVIETIGSVQAFSNAVSNIRGFEWMGEFEVEEIAPDDDFYNERGGEALDSPLRGRLYLVLTDQVAVQQLLSLWTRYSADANMSWPTGLTPLRDVFNKLYDIRRWGIEDRLLESGALESWRESLELAPNESIRTEIELWYRSSSSSRASAEQEVEALVRQAEGEVITRCTIEGIAYHALLVELPRVAVAEIVENPTTSLVQCDSIMFFRPTGQMVVGRQPDLGDELPLPDRTQSADFPTGDPCLAVLDGLPIENHALLVDRILLEDPDDLAPNYEVRDRNHGTAMCSLLIWGDLTDNEPPLRKPVYVRPILKPVPWHSEPFPELVPADHLLVDLIHRSVRRIFEGEGREQPSAPTVKIISLSIGDPSRPFYQMISPLARLLDWLSHKYGVLFVISAGNQTESIDLGVTESQFRLLSADERERLVIQKLYENRRSRRLLAPAESMNGLTVNASHFDSSQDPIPSRLFECYSTPLPSPLSSFGSGYRRAIKPDVIFPGGRQIYSFHISEPTRIDVSPFRRAPGQLVAAPGTGGDIQKTAYTRGTSNSAALVSRSLAIAHDALLELFMEQTADLNPGAYISPLLKALLVHTADWNATGERLWQHLESIIPSYVAPNRKSAELKSLISRWLGYGEPNTDRMLECTAQRATVLGFGSLEADKGHLFSLPLPPSLSSIKTGRRLTVTLAWFSPIIPTNQNYRAAHLWFEVPDSRLSPERQEADWQAVRRGTLQHEIFEGNDAIGIADGDILRIKVNCREDAGPIAEPIHYGLAVSLEVADGISLPIYQELRDRIRPEIGIRSRNPIT